MYNEYTKKLDEMGIKFEYNEFIKDTIRHKIRLVELEINQDIEEIKEKNVENVTVLHSRFIKNDRSNKENSIINFSKEREKTGIWITTQIVEASLDIDFDMLYTEMSILD